MPPGLVLVSLSRFAVETRQRFCGDRGMGRSFHVVRPLEPPLEEVEDRLMTLPRGRAVIVERPEPRLLLICEGQARLGVDGGELGLVQRGDIVVVPGPVRLAYRPVAGTSPARLHVFRIQFAPAALACDPGTGWLRPAATGDEEADFRLFVRNRFSRVRHLVRAQDPAIHTLLQALRRDAGHPTAGFRHRVSARARLLVTLIGEQVAAQGAGAPRPLESTRYCWISEQVKEFLLSNANQPVMLKDVARHLRLSPEHLARVFRRDEGTTIRRFLQDARIDRARSLLAAGELSVDEIAREAGYSSSTLFCRNFKRATGVTPASYRVSGGGHRSFSPSTVRTDGGGAPAPPPAANIKNSPKLSARADDRAVRVG